MEARRSSRRVRWGTERGRGAGEGGGREKGEKGEGGLEVRKGLNEVAALATTEIMVAATEVATAATTTVEVAATATTTMRRK